MAGPRALEIESPIRGRAIAKPISSRMEPTSTEPPPPEPEQSVAELFGELATEVGTLVRQELVLAGAEMAQKARDAARNILRMGVGALLFSVGVLVFVGALVLAVGSVVPMWAAALLTATMIGGAGYVLFRASISALRTMTFVPTETLASLREDAGWAKHEVVRDRQPAELHADIEQTRDQLSDTIGRVHRQLKPAAPKKKRRAPKSTER